MRAEFHTGRGSWRLSCQFARKRCDQSRVAESTGGDKRRLRTASSAPVSNDERSKPGSHPGNDPGNDPVTAAFVLEQTLGHITHSANLRALVPGLGGVEPIFLPVAFDPGRFRIPGWSNWTIRAGLRAWRSMLGLALSRGRGRVDAIFVHTQVPAVLLQPWMRRIPTVVSIDATPQQYDELGEFYAHGRGPAGVERVKHRMNQRCFERAAHLVTWSEWARQGLADGYGIDRDRVTTIAPGVDIERWGRPDARRSSDQPVRILFVGGDLTRKGGHVLIEAVSRLRTDAALPTVELHLVTNAPVVPSPGVFVHAGMAPNSPELVAHYHAADIFCLPTFGDCLPMVLAEAAAAGLPLVSTDVGAIHEIVRPDETGILVRPSDVEGLGEALRRLVADPVLRSRFGEAARGLAEREHDARANAQRLVTLLAEVADRNRA